MNLSCRYCAARFGSAACNGLASARRNSLPTSLLLKSRESRLRELGLDAADRLVVGVAEGPHAFAFELGREGRQVKARGLGAAQGSLGAARVGVQGRRAADQPSIVSARTAAACQLRGELIDELGHGLADWMPARFGEPLR